MGTLKERVWTAYPRSPATRITWPRGHRTLKWTMVGGKYVQVRGIKPEQGAYWSLRLREFERTYL